MAGGFMVAADNKEELVELEIAAFMGPHIKRARIALVIIGVLYAYVGWRDYGKVVQLRELLAGSAVQTQANMLYYFVIFTFLAGVANFGLAFVGGKMATRAMYIAFGIFVAHSLFLAYFAGPLILTNWQWWLTAIVLGMGFQAALKAEKLRKQRLDATL
jgi:hypothetical protein